MSNVPTTGGRRSLSKMIRAHLLFGVAGFCLGLIAAALLIQFGPEFTQASPFFTLISLVLVSTIASTMTGGLLTLSPLHTVVSDPRGRQ